MGMALPKARKGQLDLAKSCATMPICCFLAFHAVVKEFA
jgi:hypothetical protein